jgi:4-hydroxybenzoate polyprenyltransferase
MTDIPAHTDISQDGWIDRRAPQWLKPYLKLARLDRPTGIWLLLLPCWWSIALFSVDTPSGLGMTALFSAGAVLMRAAGCTVNDILDRHIDAKVERTRGRPLPSGQVGLFGAFVFLLVLLALALVVLLQLNILTVILGVASLALVGTYPLMKRLTWWPQAFLGLTFNWGAIMGWAAVTASPRHGLAAALALYAAGFFWTLIYDTIYAHQDARDDEIAGVKSTARRFGTRSRLWLIGFAVAMLALLSLTGEAAELRAPFQFMLIPIALHLGWQLVFWKTDDPADCLLRFKASKWTGLLTALAIAAGRIGG